MEKIDAIIEHHFDPQNELSIVLKSTIKSKNGGEYTKCELCYNPLRYCYCVCPYCGERDECECALFDAATGG